jgi:DNA polymerase I
VVVEAGVFVQRLRQLGVDRGTPVGLVVGSSGGFAVAVGAAAAVFGDDDADLDGLGVALMAADMELRPRWVVWSGDTLGRLVELDVRLATCWDLTVAHRLIAGGWRTDSGRVWAVASALAASQLPSTGPADLFHQSTGEPTDGPVRADGYLDPEWVDGGWDLDQHRREQWAELALVVADRQRVLLERLGGQRSLATTRSESAAELLCAELSADGLPVDRAEAERLIAESIGPRPANAVVAGEQRAARDAEVLRHAPAGLRADLRNPAQVKSLLRAIGFDVADTRAWRLDAMRGEHPLIDALLVWRKAERIATTYGYGWLDEQVGTDGRLRGAWSSCDGAAGRMTASGGLHNMPAFMRSAVIAEPGHVFVRADLGQIEPRVLAAVSGDRALIAATEMDDLYLPVATQLGVDRATAKVAMLGAMYGQTTGHGAQALRQMHRVYQTAMGYLDEADRAGQAGRDLRTFGGRLIRLSGGESEATFDEEDSPAARQAADRAERSRAASRGRYARNALVQGAAAELFKVWAVTVRARGRELGAEIVLCLHDELLVHTPLDAAEATVALVEECLGEAAYRWAPGSGVRFLAEVSTIERWSEAKS